MDTHHRGKTVQLLLASLWMLVWEKMRPHLYPSPYKNHPRLLAEAQNQRESWFSIIALNLFVTVPIVPQYTQEYLLRKGQKANLKSVH